MSHSDVIIITVALFLTSTVGVYATIRCINQHINPPINSLSRRGDIELQYIEPSTNNTLDLLQPQQIYTSNINCSLEHSINLNYILFNLFFIVVLTIIFYLKNKTK